MDKRFLPNLQSPLDEEHTVNRFAGKLAVVTGGASGIGFATVYRLAHDGAKVLILDINEEAGKEAEQHVRECIKTDVFFQMCDVSNFDQCHDVISKFVTQQKQRIDILVNNAVSFISKGLDSTPNDWGKSLEVNVAGTSNMVQACFPHFHQDNSSVVNMSSTSATLAQINRWTYSAGKAAILQLTKCMALDLAKHNVRVNSVAPSWTWSPQVSKVAPNGSEEELEKITNDFHLIPKMCRTTQVASVIAFLCSRDASYITGANIPVDGGYTAMGPEGKGTKSKFAD